MIEDIQQFEKLGFQNIFDDPSFFNSLCSRKRKSKKKSREHANLCGKKEEEILNSIIAQLTARPTLRINRKIDFEK